MQTFGEGLNGFFQQLEWKTIIGLPVMMFGFLSVFNVFFFFDFFSTYQSKRMLQSHDMYARSDSRMA